MTSVWVHDRRNTGDSLDQTNLGKGSRRILQLAKQCQKLSHRTWRRIIVCSENGGEHTDILNIYA